MTQQPEMSQAASDNLDPSHAVAVPGATWSIFGHDEVPVELYVVPRTSKWRVRRAGTILGGAAVLAPPLAVLPPHFVWSFGSLLTGAFLARARWKERHTIQSLSGRCPRCDQALTLGSGKRLHYPHPVECEGCGHQGQIRFQRTALPHPS